MFSFVSLREPNDLIQHKISVEHLFIILFSFNLVIDAIYRLALLIQHNGSLTTKLMTFFFFVVINAIFDDVLISLVFCTISSV